MEMAYRKDSNQGVAHLRKELFKNERLSTNIKLPLYKAMNKSVMTYACSIWEYASYAYLFKEQSTPRCLKF
jgi:hypothetical protein